MERYIPLATRETERGEVLDVKPEEIEARPAPETRRARETRAVRDTGSRSGEHRRTAETTRQMPALPHSKTERVVTAPRAGAAPRAAAPAPQVRREPRREAQRPVAAKPKKVSSTITQPEHVVIADAVRLLGWGRQWHEIAEMIARLAERPAPSEIRRILRTYRDHIDAIMTRRRD